MNNKIFSLTQQNETFKKSLHSYEQETKKILRDLKNKCDQLHNYELKITEAKFFMQSLEKLLLDEDFYISNKNLDNKYQNIIERIHLLKFNREI